MYDNTEDMTEAEALSLINSEIEGATVENESEHAEAGLPSNPIEVFINLE